MCKISLKPGNRLLSYGEKRFFNMAAVRHLEFKKVVTWSRTVTYFGDRQTDEQTEYCHNVSYGKNSMAWLPDG